jgi:uncharacterized protein YndB with AHSA1/START domain
MSTDRIERATLIDAPIDRVWRLITEAEHLGTWFGDAGAQIDLRPGGRLELRWDGGHVVSGVVEVVEPPHRFAYRWLLDADGPPTPANSTLVEFTLQTEGSATRLQVVESGFDRLDQPAERRQERLASHTTGWPQELGHLVEHARSVAT